MADTLAGWQRHTEAREGSKPRIWYTSPDGETYSAAAYAAIARYSQDRKDGPEPSKPAPEEWTAMSGEALVSPGRPLETGRARPNDPRATSDQIAESFARALLISTGIVAFILRLEELEPTAEEAAEIAAPVGNLLSGSDLNRRYGHVFRDMGDWSALGYAVGRMGLRIAGDVRAAQDQRRSSSNPPAPGPPAATVPVSIPVIPGGPAHAAPVPQSAPQHATGSPQARSSESGTPVLRFAPQGAGSTGYSPIPRVSPASPGAPAGSHNGTPASAPPNVQ